MRKNKKNNPVYYFVIFIGLIIVSTFLFRFLLPKNIWLCKNGQWIKIGQPIGQQPEASTCVLEN